MRKYRVNLSVAEARLFGNLTVEAEDEEQAKEIVLGRAYDVKFKYSYDHDLLFIDNVNDVGPAKSCRKMASIQMVTDTWAIPEADAIEGCQVLGWKCVIKKGELKAGDLCVYFEIDSLLPKKPEYAFMESRHYRVRTVKLRGQVAQGLALPLSAITYADLSSFVEGDDVTEILEVEKYEGTLPACLRGKVAGVFPGFIPKTDEERIQGMPRVLTQLAGRAVCATEKLDGSSFTAYVRDDINSENYDPQNPVKKFGVCSRNLELKPDGDYFTDGDIKNTFWKVAKQEDVESKLRRTGKNIAIQGEMVGLGIQKNKYYLQGVDLYLFNVFDIDEQRYYNPVEMADFCKEYNFKMVPVVEIFVLDHTVDGLVEMSLGKSVLCNKTEREGLVIRTIDGERVSFKVINPVFLLKNKE
ncbi:MAG TPA: RNA ligase (ATP) [Candidatus Glassbacteria bacterium]|nr:RNA ligase (ATP) [Candidatus Glassbacteria bacterium]